MSNKGGQSLKETLQSAFATSAILIAFIVSVLVYKFIMGNPANFEGGNPAGHPIPGNYLAMIYKGGMIVPLLMTCVLVVIIFCFERAIMIRKARGKANVNVFVKNIQNLLANNQIEEANALCDKQKG